MLAPSLLRHSALTTIVLKAHPQRSRPSNFTSSSAQENSTLQVHPAKQTNHAFLPYPLLRGNRECRRSRHAYANSTSHLSHKQLSQTPGSYRRCETRCSRHSQCSQYSHGNGTIGVLCRWRGVHPGVPDGTWPLNPSRHT